MVDIFQWQIKEIRSIEALFFFFFSLSGGDLIVFDAFFLSMNASLHLGL